MTQLNRVALWQAGEQALRSCNADVESAAVWTKIGALIWRLPHESHQAFLRAAATALDGMGSATARAYAQTCDALADSFDSGVLSDEALLDMTRRMSVAQLSPQLRWVGRWLRSLGWGKQAGDKTSGFLSLGLGLLEAPPEKRFRLAAELFVSLSALGEDDAAAATARCLTEALLREIDRQRRAAPGAESPP